MSFLFTLNALKTTFKALTLKRSFFTAISQPKKFLNHVIKIKVNNFDLFLRFPRNFSVPSKNSSLSLEKDNSNSPLNIVLWKIYANFRKHNTLITLVSVAEDPNFIAKNSSLSYNDLVFYYAHLPHMIVLHFSAGLLGYRKAARSEYDAGFQVSTQFFRTIHERRLIAPDDKVEIIFRDFGKGREAFIAALKGREGENIRDNIVRLYDNTRLRFGGVRSKKLRRL